MDRRTRHICRCLSEASTGHATLCCTCTCRPTTTPGDTPLARTPSCKSRCRSRSWCRPQRLRPPRSPLPGSVRGTPRTEREGHLHTGQNLTSCLPVHRSRSPIRPPRWYRPWARCSRPADNRSRLQLSASCCRSRRHTLGRRRRWCRRSSSSDRHCPTDDPVNGEMIGSPTARCRRQQLVAARWLRSIAHYKRAGE